MHLKRSRIEPSPEAPDRVRLSADIVYEDGGAETLWFDVPEGCADGLSVSGNPWLACLLPLAVTAGERLRLDEPVERGLLDNAQEVMQVWKSWYPHLHVVPVEAEDFEDASEERPSLVAAFFSGGVDSFFTALRHAGRGTGDRLAIDDLLCVWGFDVPLSNRDAFRRMRDSLRRAAEDMSLRLIDVATNLREARRRASWGLLHNGAALAGVGLALENRYRAALIGSSYPYSHMAPWGSHSLTDPLFSTARTRIVHDGAASTRVEKTEYISRSEAAMRSLRVCWKHGNEANCGACNKCVRTMLTLELLGALGRCRTFPAGSFSVERVEKLFCPDERDRFFLGEIHDRAVAEGRHGLAKAIERSLKRSARLREWLAAARRLNSKRFVWRWSESIERALLADSIV